MTVSDWQLKADARRDFEAALITAESDQLSGSERDALSLGRSICNEIEDSER